MLHIVNKSPSERNALDSCLRFAKAGTPILLIEDGVYAAVRGSKAADRLQSASGSHTFYVLGEDVAARGLSENLVSEVTTVDYGGFVDLVAENETNQSWL